MYGIAAITAAGPRWARYSATKVECLETQVERPEFYAQLMSLFESGVAGRGGGCELTKVLAQDHGEGERLVQMADRGEGFAPVGDDE